MDLDTIRHKMDYLKLQYVQEQIQDVLDTSLREEETHLEFVSRLLETEISFREERRMETSLKLSGLPKGMRTDNFDYLFQPAVDKSRIDFLSSGEFIRKKENVLFFGPPGVGKTHLAAALGIRAIEMGYSTIYYTAEELLADMKKKADIPVSRHRRKAYAKNALVIIDELGYQTLDRQETHLFFQLISHRYQRHSTIITSNRSVREWVSVFDSDHVATGAILDRLMHNAHIFSIDGKSYRMKDVEATLMKR